MAVAAPTWSLTIEREDPHVMRMRLGGAWRTRDRLPSAGAIDSHLRAEPPVSRVVLDAREVTEWDTGLVVFVVNALQRIAAHDVPVERVGLPEGVQRLVALATAVPEARARAATPRPSWLERIGLATLGMVREAGDVLRFLGEATQAFGRLLTGRADFPRSDFALIVQECGPSALPIVTLISFLVGLILAFVGAVQLRQFGAQIYVADLVAIAMATEMGALMTAILMAGRTGAAFAAQLGTMKVNEEIDALITTGIPPMEYLVLPRMLALIVMMPLLTIYADVIGMIGGGVIGVSFLGLGVWPYWEETKSALTLLDFVKGLLKSSVFGVLVAVAGCLRGLQSGRSAAAVGLAATSAVVTAIVFIVVADGIITVLYDVLGW